MDATDAAESSAVSATSGWLLEVGVRLSLLLASQSEAAEEARDSEAWSPLAPQQEPLHGERPENEHGSG